MGSVSQGKHRVIIAWRSSAARLTELGGARLGAPGAPGAPGRATAARRSTSTSLSSELSLLLLLLLLSLSCMRRSDARALPRPALRSPPTLPRDFPPRLALLRGESRLVGAPLRCMVVQRAVLGTATKNK